MQCVGKKYCDLPTACNLCDMVLTHGCDLLGWQMSFDPLPQLLLDLP